MIPASLIVVLTITFAVSTKRIAERHVIVRKLDSIEALGAVSDICSDKTGEYEIFLYQVRVLTEMSGTLTQGRMVTRVAWAPALGTWTLRDSLDPFDPTSGRMDFRKGTPSSATSRENDGGGGQLDPSYPEMAALLECASLCNIASVFQEHREADGEKHSAENLVWAARGDPTEMCVFSNARIPR